MEVVVNVVGFCLVLEERAAQETVRENQQAGAFVSTEEAEGFIKRYRDDDDDHDLRQLNCGRGQRWCRRRGRRRRR
jgi:hypothetical protein